MAQKPDKELISIFDLETTTGQAEELKPTDKARLSIAKWVLGALAIIFIAAAACLIFGPQEKLQQTQTVFDFVKTIVPPIVTLVIGFYFKSESA